MSHVLKFPRKEAFSFGRNTAIPRLVRVMRSKKMAFALTEFALIEVEYM